MAITSTLIHFGGLKLISFRNRKINGVSRRTRRLSNRRQGTHTRSQDARSAIIQMWLQEEAEKDDGANYTAREVFG